MAVSAPPGYIQASTYTAADDRRNINSAPMQRSLADLTNMGARGGFVAGKTPSLSVAGMVVTVGQFVATIENTFATNAGEYRAQNVANQNLTLAAASPTQNRIDTVAVRIQDAFYSGALNQGDIVVVQGAYSSGAPSAPALPSSTLPLGDYLVNANNTTPASFTDRRRTTVAAGGITPATTPQDADNGAFASELKINTANLLQRWSGSAWETMASASFPRGFIAELKGTTQIDFSAFVVLEYGAVNLVINRRYKLTYNYAYKKAASDSTYPTFSLVYQAGATLTTSGTVVARLNVDAWTLFRQMQLLGTFTGPSTAQYAVGALGNNGGGSAASIGADGSLARILLLEDIGT